VFIPAPEITTTEGEIDTVFEIAGLCLLVILQYILIDNNYAFYFSFRDAYYRR